MKQVEWSKSKLMTALPDPKNGTYKTDNNRKSFYI